MIDDSRHRAVTLLGMLFRQASLVCVNNALVNDAVEEMMLACG